MKKGFTALFALVILAIPAVCLATPPVPGAYVSGFIGASIPNDTDVTGSAIDDRVRFDPGVNLGATGGFDFGMLRLEGELSYKHGEITSVVINANSSTPERFRSIDGRIGVMAMMGNMFIDLHNPSPITPYFGGGIGFAAVHQDDTFGTSTINGDRLQLYESDDDAVFAYQAGGGLEISLNRILSLDLSYRYFRTSRASFNDDSFSIDNELKFESHNAAAGIRVKF